jgi:hypothetical protein
MSKTIVILMSFALASTAFAKDKDKVTALPAKVAAAISGKTIAVTRHERPSFTAMTAGKASFGLFGAAAMISAGNKIVTDNGISDPADLLEQNLAPAVAKHLGAQLQSGPAPVIKGGSPKQLAAAANGADYVLDIESKGWMFAYYPTDWNTYWIGYAVETSLVDAKTAKVLSTMSCYADTNKHPSSPGRDAMLANGAQVIKDVTASLGWRCLHRVGGQEFAMAEGELPATPEALVDPLVALPASAGAAGAGGK